jgi:crotonobetainyl-CoA:carnitine CoA-transferase CaiB-like acyl-CoA transferase
MRPLEGLLVVDFSQFLAGPSASLRLSDLGARVIKIERPESGDLCRHLYISNLELDGDSTLFHSINRNKESFVADLKHIASRTEVHELLRNADIVIHNFRPGVMERLGCDYESVIKINPQVVYGEITGYGNAGPWRDKPGQDLLVQSLSGLPWLSGDADDPPTPFGLAVADLCTGAHLVQGILACLVRKGVTGCGGRVEVSLMESILDLQFEVLTTHLNDGGKLPQRSGINNAHAYLGAPYGIYRTVDGYLALAMGSITQLGALMECPELARYSDSASLFDQRDEIKMILEKHILQETTQHWLAILEPADVWCAEVLNMRKLVEHDGFKVLDMVQDVVRPECAPLRTLRCPIHIDGELLKSSKGAPRLGADTDAIRQEFISHKVRKQETR